MDNIQSFDTFAQNTSLSRQQSKSKKSSLKLRNLQSSVVDLLFPSCCKDPILWVILRHGTIFIWSYIADIAEGPRWVPTGQFYIVNINEVVHVESIIFHKQSNTLLWCEVSDGKRAIKKMSLPTDVSNITSSSDIMPGVTTVLENSPQTKFYISGDSVVFKFLSPCPPAIHCTWHHPNRIRFYLADYQNYQWKCIHNSIGSVVPLNFVSIVNQLARFWANFKLPKTIFTIINPSKDNTILILNCGTVYKLLPDFTVKKLFVIKKFSPNEVIGCFYSFNMIFCVSESFISIYSLSSCQMIEVIDVNSSVRDIFSHDCCLRTAGVTLNNGKALCLRANDPSTVFKFGNHNAAAILGTINQQHFELLSHLRQILVEENFANSDIKKINDQILSTCEQNETIKCLIQHQLKNSASGMSFDLGARKKGMQSEHMTLAGCYKRLEELKHEVIENVDV